MDEVVINLLWLPQAQFAGYLMAEHLDLGAPRGLRIRTTPIDFSLGPVGAVAGGVAQFGIASPSHLLEAAEPGQFRLLLVFQQDSPLVYPVRRESGIERLHDFIGRKVAVWPGKEDLEFRWMLHKTGLDPDRVERLPMADTVAGFLAGEVDSAQMTSYHELHLLEEQMPSESLRLFKAADYGAALVKDGLFTSRRLTETKPGLVQRVVDTVLEGWARAFAEPEQAVEICARARPDLSRQAEARQFADIRALTFRHATLTHGLGYPDPAHLQRAAQALTDLGEPVDAAGATELGDLRFWRDAPATYRVMS
jgi:NitT/TauT family transport system substrate-binding protein